MPDFSNPNRGNDLSAISTEHAQTTPRSLTELVDLCNCMTSKIDFFSSNGNVALIVGGLREELDSVQFDAAFNLAMSEILPEPQLSRLIPERACQLMGLDMGLVSKINCLAFRTMPSLKIGNILARYISIDCDDIKINDEEIQLLQSTIEADYPNVWEQLNSRRKEAIRRIAGNQLDTIKIAESFIRHTEQLFEAVKP